MFNYNHNTPFITSLSLLKGDVDHPSPSVTQLKVSIKVDDNKPCMNFTPQLLINNTNEFRWVGTVLGKWFLAGEHWFQVLPLENGTKLALSKENVSLVLELAIQAHGFCRKYKKGAYCYE